MVNLKYRFNSLTLREWQISHDRGAVPANLQLNPGRPCAAVQNRKPDRAKSRRAHHTGHAADFDPGQTDGRADGRHMRIAELKSEHPFFQTAARGRPLDSFLPQVASLGERDCTIEPRLECDRLVSGIDTDECDAVLDADSFERARIDAARMRRFRKYVGDGRINRIARSDYGYSGSAVTRQVADQRAAGFDEAPRGQGRSSLRRAGRVDRKSTRL